MVDEYPTYDRKIYFLLILVIAVILVSIVVYSVMKIQKKPVVCGNDVCESSENKCTCPKDCGECSGACGTCKEYSCANRTCQCTTKTSCCGNGVCEIGEDEWSCCDDCKCNVEGMACNITSHACATPPSNMTDDEAISIFKTYLISIGKNSSEVTDASYDVSSSVYDGKPAKRVCTMEPGPIVKGVCGLISESKEVVDFKEYL